MLISPESSQNYPLLSVYRLLWTFLTLREWSTVEDHRLPVAPSGALADSPPYFTDDYFVALDRRGCKVRTCHRVRAVDRVDVGHWPSSLT